MTYQELKSRIAKVFQVNGDEYRTITQMIKVVEDEAYNASYGGEGASPEQIFRMYMVAVARILADYADQ
jgi:hypothetical protein